MATTKNLTYEKCYTGSKEVRGQALGQRPLCIWLTGLSGAGKSTLAAMLDERLRSQGKHVYVLDGDNIRHGLNKDLGFSDADRKENIRRVAEVARLMVDAGLIVIVAFISPFISDRKMARSLFEGGEFWEVFIDAPLQDCERRDPKGLYALARLGKLPDFTGIDSPYEPPQSPEIHVKTAETPINHSLSQILLALQSRLDNTGS